MEAIADIGFMQGRLSPLVNNRIQAFPWDTWQREICIASQLGFRVMEWTIDQERLHENPLLTVAGQAEIAEVCQRYGVSIPSLTGDCFMQAPFWKAAGDERRTLEDDFLAVSAACAAVGISMIVVPLVDNGRVESPAQEDTLVEFLERHATLLATLGLQVVFESDGDPEALARFIGRLDRSRFGINYDIGNSAALGFDPRLEIRAYGDRILNVHVKDRLRGGPTVALGNGHADFDAVFAALRQAEYRGHYILQTARAVDDDHASVLCRYRDMTAHWVSRHSD
jgi:L-ribulose-5-phosphate 3-epimerase